ncbi:hypothetical protein FBY14_110152 [Azospirillum brasilense]|nr:hypothetical protein FBY14_110152 [Azospirillum brasilense]
MRGVFGALVLACVLVGCTSPNPRYQAYLAGEPYVIPVLQSVDGRPGFRMEDVTRCRIAATQAVPSRPVGVPLPEYTSPTQTACYRLGGTVSCNTTGGGTLGGGTAVVDANEGLRGDAVRLCLADLGYRDFPVPACPPGADFSQKLAVGSRTLCYAAAPSGDVTFGSFWPPGTW